MRDKNKTKEQLVKELVEMHQRAAKSKAEPEKAADVLRRIEWLLKKKPTVASSEVKQVYEQPYGSLSKLNTTRLILDSVGKEVLSDIVSDYLNLLETSSAIYEKNGDYALGIFSSGWCRFLDYSSRKMCRTADNREALQSGLWHCHESCWNEASRISIETAKPVDIECRGGIRLYATPIFAGSEIIGSINFGYGDPPQDIEKLKEIALRYGVNAEELRMHSSSCESRPFFIIELSKNQLHASARIIGEIVNRRRAEKELEKQHAHLEELIEERTVGLKKTNEGLRLEITEVLEALNKIASGDPRVRIPEVSENEMIIKLKQVVNKTAKEIGAIVDQSHEFAIGLAEHFDVLSRVSKGKLNARITEEAQDELLRALGRVTNRMIESVSREITERKQAEEEVHKLNEELEQRIIQRTAELAAANRELESFSYSVSHDLRAPLRAIDGFSKILFEDYADKLDDEGKRLFDVIRDNTKKMSNLIDDLLALSRIGRKDIELSDIDMDKLAKTVCDEIEAANHERKLQFDIKALPPAYADSGIIRQVFFNFLFNATKFTKHRETAIIEVGGYFDGSENVYYVKDNGVGFDMRYKDKLFGAFQRLHSEKEFEGTGIGLAIVQRIINRHGGRIWAEGKVDEGATFYFTLPKHSSKG